jgi:hypothetical protein
MVFQPHPPNNPLTKAAYDYAARILEQERTVFRNFLGAKHGSETYATYVSSPALCAAPLRNPPIKNGMMYCLTQLVTMLVPDVSSNIPLKLLKQV